jgi:two-component system LytT family sensor kinase
VRKRVWLIWVLAFLGWMLIGLSFSINDFLFRDFLTSYYGGSPSLRSMLFWDLVYWPTWVVLAPLIFLSVRRFPLGRNSWHPNLLINVAAVLSLTILQRIIYLLIAWPIQRLLEGDNISFRQLLLYNLPTGFMCCVLILLVGHLINYYKRYRDEELRVSQLKAELAEDALQLSRLKAELTEAELRALNMQLRPHFLFNTLGNISALLSENVKAADKMLERLGAFLRLTLEKSGAQVVTLEEELEFLRRYLEIEQVRLEDRLQVRYDVEAQALTARVPNLILQPLIENAIKHGVGQSFGQVQIVVSANQKDGRLCLHIKDNGEGTNTGGNGHKEGFGIRNTRERLESAYGSDARFDLTRAQDGWTVAVLEMPLLNEATDL